MTEGIHKKYSESQSATVDGWARKTLAIDSGSPVSSLALEWGNQRRTRQFAVGDSSRRLIADLDSMLDDVGGTINELDSLVALRGPGSFTGLRVGLATVLGLHQALGIAATAISTFATLAWQAKRRTELSEQTIVTAVDALRGEHFVQKFDGATLRPLAEPTLQASGSLAAERQAVVIGFGLASRAANHLDAEPLAADLLDLAAEASTIWDPRLLTEPLYLRPPAVTPNKESGSGTPA